MRGVAFIVEPYLLSSNSDVVIRSDDNIFTGQVITAMKEACREAIL
jgi:ribosome assembly protein 1